MRKITLLIVLTLYFSNISAQHYAQKYYPETDKVTAKKIEEWQNMKFGLLMHWGAYSQWGVVESWSICAEDVGWTKRKKGKTPENYTEYKKEYEQLKNSFNPVKFNPDKWAKAADYAGMKYVIFTTKHHDGFCMFDTKYTDYKVTDKDCAFSSNKKANITKEIFDAFRKKGFWVGPYFSKPDWHNENYWWPNFATPDRNVNYDIKKHPKRWEKYVQFTHNQIMELMTDYGKIDILWLDGGWVAPLTREQIVEYMMKPDYQFMHLQSQDVRMSELKKKAREKQPGLIVVDRAVEGPNQNYLTPENQIPGKLLPYPWESCIIAGGGWSYVPDAKFMNTRKLIYTLVDIVSKGGNLLLNIAPSPEGTWDKAAYDLLNEMGDWMKINGEAIYNSKPLSPYKDGKVCLTQQDNGTVYAIYLSDKDENKPPSKIWMNNYQPNKNAQITMLGSKTKLKWEAVGNGFEVIIPESLQKKAPCNYAWVLKIKKN